MDFALRVVRADDPIIEPPRKGHARTPKWITAIPESELSDAAKVVLDAVLGHCFGDSRECFFTLAQLSEDCGGMHAKKLQRALRELRELEKHPLIRRVHDPSQPGGNAWKTIVLFDPRGDRPPALWGDTSVHTPGHQCPHPRTPVSTPPSLISTRVRQEFLEFERTTTTEPQPSSSLESQIDLPKREVAAQAFRLFPEIGPDRSRLEAVISAHGIERVALALEMAQLLAKDAKRKPRIFQWLPGTLKNWRERSIESIRAELDAVRGPKPAQPVYHQAAEQPADPAAPPELSAEWSALIRKGRIAEALALVSGDPPAQKKSAAGPLAKDHPQPIGDTTQVRSLGVAVTAEAGRQWSGRGSNPQPPHCEREGFSTAEISCEDPPRGVENASQVARERRVRNAALSPDGPDPLNYTARLSPDQNLSPGSGD